jgi:hypothetical protein
MSLVVERFLICDGIDGKKRSLDCEENFGVDSRSSSTKQQRQSAKKNGWHTNGQHDWCPACYRVRKES